MDSAVTTERKREGSMAGLFDSQAKQYAEARPEYPPELFSFIASHTPKHDVAWDVATGTGQSAVPLSRLYQTVIATDISAPQLSFAQKRSNIRYAVTPPAMSLEELESTIGPAGSVDLVTVAQALHWFDLDSFYAQARHVLRKPGGVLAVWCYGWPSIEAEVDKVFRETYAESSPFWDSARRFVDNEYQDLQFPLEAIGDGVVRFEATKQMSLQDLLNYIETWSAFQTAKANGVNLLNEETVRRFREAWGADQRVLTATWPIVLRIGTF